VTVLSGAQVVTPDGVLESGWVEVDGGRIAGVGSGADRPGSSEVVALDGGWLVPGFIDLHVHGGGGHDFATSAEAMAAGVDYHLSRGTTRSLVSIMAGSVDDMCEQLGWVAEVAGLARPGRGQVAGAHLEGPFLAHARCGAQNPHHLLAPDRLVLAKLLEAGQGLVRTVTLAPELPGALALIGDIVEAGAVAAVGHTDASYEEAMAGFDAGASLATHLFNAMGAVNQRAPGASVAAIEAGVWLELINDGVHVHDALTRLVLRDSSARAVLITDAISATGAPDGEYVLGGQPVVSRLGTVRVVETGRLAGSTLTMDAAVRRTIQDLGLPITLAVAAASASPARALGIDDRCGSIAAGLDADLVHLGDDLRVRRVMVGGKWVEVAPQR
jgi:N-acetylglucosamine-6-phosphate deacetylase